MSWFRRVDLLKRRISKKVNQSINRLLIKKTHMSDDLAYMNKTASKK